MIDIHNMTDQELNEAIAKKKGWIYFPDSHWKWVRYYDEKECEGDYQSDMPDYIHDWNLAGGLLEEMRWYIVEISYNAENWLLLLNTPDDIRRFEGKDLKRVIDEAWLERNETIGIK